MLKGLYQFPKASLIRYITIPFMRLPVTELAVSVAVVGCLASGAFALGWRIVAKRTSLRVLRHDSASYLV